MTPIVIQQYQETEPRTISPEALQHLVVGYSDRLDIRPAGGTAVRLKGTNYVGLIRTPGLDVMVQPKIDTLSVFWMLGFAHRLVDLDLPEFPLDVDAGLLDVLARLFAKQTEIVIRRGIHRAYVEHEENLRYVRGRIEPLADLRANHGLRHRLPLRRAHCGHDPQPRIAGRHRAASTVPIPAPGHPRATGVERSPPPRRQSGAHQRALNSRAPLWKAR